MKPFIRYWLPAIVLCTVIFGQSSFATPDVLPGWPLQDKALHAGVYGLLGLLWARAFNTLNPWRGRSLLLIVTAVLLATLFGISDEWHQSFVPARSAEAADVLADFIGSLAGSWLFVRFRIVDKSTLVI